LLITVEKAVGAWIREGGGSWFERFLWDGTTTEGDVRRIAEGAMKIGLAEGLLDVVKRGRGGERTAFRLLKVMGGLGKRVREEEVWDDEMDMICDLVLKGRERWGVEEREDLEDAVEEAVKVLPSGIREGIEVEEAISLELEDDREEGEGNKIEVMVGKVMTWLLLCEWCEACEKRSMLGLYVDATGAVGRMMGFVGKMIEDAEGEGLEGGGGWREGRWDGGGWGEDEVWSLCLEATVRGLVVFPGLVRGWWVELKDKGVKEAVLEFVEKRASRVVLGKEMDKIIKAGRDVLGDMDVKGSIVSGVITASYMQDEVELAVVVKAPKTFPLRNVEVDASMGGGDGGQGMKWGLMMNCSLQQGDGGILEALLLWKGNVDAEFEGVEPCPICYAVLDTKSRSKPNVECGTCHNRFHKGCVVTWFAQKQTNNCVICQQPMNNIGGGGKRRGGGR